MTDRQRRANSGKVPCPVCLGEFWLTEIEMHASQCVEKLRAATMRSANPPSTTTTTTTTAATSSSSSSNTNRGSTQQSSTTLANRRVGGKPSLMPSVKSETQRKATTSKTSALRPNAPDNNNSASRGPATSASSRQASEDEVDDVTDGEVDEEGNNKHAKRRRVETPNEGERGSSDNDEENGQGGEYIVEDEDFDEIEAGDAGFEPIYTLPGKGMSSSSTAARPASRRGGKRQAPAMKLPPSTSSSIHEKSISYLKLVEHDEDEPLIPTSTTTVDPVMRERALFAKAAAMAVGANRRAMMAQQLQQQQQQLATTTTTAEETTTTMDFEEEEEEEDGEGGGGAGYLFEVPKWEELIDVGGFAVVSAKNPIILGGTGEGRASELRQRVCDLVGLTETLQRDNEKAVIRANELLEERRRAEENLHEARAALNNVETREVGLQAELAAAKLENEKLAAAVARYQHDLELARVKQQHEEPDNNDAVKKSRKATPAAKSKSRSLATRASSSADDDDPAKPPVGTLSKSSKVTEPSSTSTPSTAALTDDNKEEEDEGKRTTDDGVTKKRTRASLSRLQTATTTATTPVSKIDMEAFSPVTPPAVETRPPAKVTKEEKIEYARALNAWITKRHPKGMSSGHFPVFHAVHPKAGATWDRLVKNYLARRPSLSSSPKRAAENREKAEAKLHQKLRLKFVAKWGEAYGLAWADAKYTVLVAAPVTAPPASSTEELSDSATNKEDEDVARVSTPPVKTTSSKIDSSSPLREPSTASTSGEARVVENEMDVEEKSEGERTTTAVVVGSSSLSLDSSPSASPSVANAEAEGESARQSAAATHTTETGASAAAGALLLEKQNDNNVKPWYDEWDKSSVFGKFLRFIEVWLDDDTAEGEGRLLDALAEWKSTRPAANVEDRGEGGIDEEEEGRQKSDFNVDDQTVGSIFTKLRATPRLPFYAWRVPHDADGVNNERGGKGGKSSRSSVGEPEATDVWLVSKKRLKETAFVIISNHLKPNTVLNATKYANFLRENWKIANLKEWLPVTISQVENTFSGKIRTMKKKDVGYVYLSEDQEMVDEFFRKKEEKEREEEEAIAWARKRQEWEASGSGGSNGGASNNPAPRVGDNSNASPQRKYQADAAPRPVLTSYEDVVGGDAAKNKRGGARRYDHHEPRAVSASTWTGGAYPPAGSSSSSSSTSTGPPTYYDDPARAGGGGGGRPMVGYPPAPSHYPPPLTTNARVGGAPYANVSGAPHHHAGAQQPYYVVGTGPSSSSSSAPVHAPYPGPVSNNPGNPAAYRPPTQQHYHPPPQPSQIPPTHPLPMPVGGGVPMNGPPRDHHYAQPQQPYPSNSGAPMGYPASAIPPHPSHVPIPPPQTTHWGPPPNPATSGNGAYVPSRYPPGY